MKINIAIDGPSASGKSTIAKRLAAELGYIHIDTGAMYRCVAYLATKLGIDFSDEKSLGEMAERMDITLTTDGRVFLNQTDVTDAIRQEEISIGASKVSIYSKVRSAMVKRQQQMAKSKGFIVDGRDIGTVVLPDAEVKIFQTASAASRAMRRYKENQSKGIDSDFELLKSEIEQRDYQDTHRKESPLRKAEDAIEIDTSEMTVEQVVSTIKSLVAERSFYD
ncbi:MAG: (d)CMP kinase [Erysipelothrix sp.]|nr:(d)CMP kinase [Erysipelothrix sp.]